MIYALTNGDGVTRNADGASIPSDPDNRDWAAYQEWLADGNTPDPMPTPVPDPDATTQAALAASARDKIATIAALTPGEESAIFPPTEGTP